MTGIDRSGKSHVGTAGADSAGRSSSSRSESTLVPGEGSQFFDSVLERMRSEPQDRAPPHASHLPTSGVTAPRGDKIRAAKRKMGSLLEDLDACRNAAMHAQNKSSRQAQQFSTTTRACP